MLKYMRVIITFLLMEFVCAGCGDDKLKYLDLETEKQADNNTSVASGEELDTEYEASEANETSEANKTNAEPFPVYVCGAVVNPGVYYFDSGDIKQSAVDAAGGFCENAAKDYVNLAQELTNNEKLYIPTEDEVANNMVPDMAVL